jgi:hypothetical protein
MEDVGLFYGHLVYFTGIWSILRAFGLFYGKFVYAMPIKYTFVCYGHLVYFPHFGML